MATTRRNYITAAEVNSLVGVTPTEIQLELAESLIDSYAGFIQKWMRGKVEGVASGGGASSLTLMQKHVNLYDENYFVGCEVKILGGTGKGQRRTITASTKAGVLTTDTAWDTAPDSTSFYRIYQFAKFPRPQDVVHYTEVSPAQVYKEVPEAVRNAVAAQVEYIDQMGNEYFESDKSEKVRERIGDYEYENAASGVGYTGISRLIAPKAKSYLKGIRCIVGGD